MDVDGIISALYESMSESRERSLKHYPSGLPYPGLGKCSRAIAYSMTNTSPSDPIPNTSLLKMEMGRGIHAWLGGVLSKLVDVQLEVPFEWHPERLSYPISGKLDVLATLGSQRVCIEWKSTFGIGATMVKKEGPKPEHLLQTMAYLKQPVIPVDSAALVYISGDSGYMLGWQATLGETLLIRKFGTNEMVDTGLKWSIVEDALFSIEEHIKGGRLPDGEYRGDPKPWQCRYCQWRRLCYGEL